MKPLRLKGFATEDHDLELQLIAELGVCGIGGLQRIERRRRLAQRRDLLRNQQRVKVFRRTHHRIRHHDHPSAVQQRAPDLPYREVEGQRMTLRPDLPVERHVGVQRLQ
ncbi:hypothetical protein BOO86_03090 [Mycobacterium sp. CBMA 234]|nr:hypothetical protein [Mycolicibacterium sp. CBMA 234]